MDGGRVRNVLNQGAAVSVATDQRICPSCEQRKPVDAFYTSSPECRRCKRARSQANRHDRARRLAAFERFVDVLEDLAVQGCLVRVGTSSEQRHASEATAAS